MLATIVNMVDFPITSPRRTIEKTLAPLEFTTGQLAFNHFEKLVVNDVKDPVLKSLQGEVWELGYETGEIRAPVYKDAIKFIETFPNVYIYSSGSIAAQKLLFGYVLQGEGSIDLNKFIKGYFDIPAVGYKFESSSYTKILQEIGRTGEEVLFLSDNVAEVDAAIQAGMQSYIVVREGNAPLSQSDTASHTTITSFDQLNI
ncbi:Enolase-phosphatase E1 [Spathaspora sp. JA1]|nr:Enolase-phosphatase E1 [Spathaspora sp. JA1]